MAESMRVELIVPAAEDSAVIRSLAMATLAALTPDDVELTLRDDTVKKIEPARDLDGNVDLAAITVSTKTAIRAYELAAAYRKSSTWQASAAKGPMRPDTPAHCEYFAKSVREAANAAREMAAEHEQMAKDAAPNRK